MHHRHKEVLVNILKIYGGTTPRTVSPHPNVPTPQDHILQQMLYQQQQQRIPSPMNNGELYMLSIINKSYLGYTLKRNIFLLFLYLFSILIYFLTCFFTVYRFWFYVIFIKFL